MHSVTASRWPDVAVEKKRKEKDKATPFGINLMRSQVLNQAAQGEVAVHMLQVILENQRHQSYIVIQSESDYMNIHHG